jgi:ABC-type Fe3+/spermidine/putrescine transport system ATPase subunit
MTQLRVLKKCPGFVLDIDLPLHEGVTAVYGPAGAGKTLLLDLVAGYVAPDSGRILLGDAILYDADTGVNVPPRLRNTAYLPAQDALFPHLSIRKNLIFAARRYARLERHRRVAEMMERFQLADKLPRDLTAGERLRSEIARALVPEPRLLLLDGRVIEEPLLRQIRDAARASILMVTPDLDLACAIADDLVLLDAGRILQRGAPTAVLDHPASVEIARLIGIANILQASIAELDPGRNTSRLEFDGFSVGGPYIPGHFKGDRVWVAVRADDLRVYPSGAHPPPNAVSARLVKTSNRARGVRMEFEGTIVADVSRAEFERQRDNQTWWVEFPVGSLRVL